MSKAPSKRKSKVKSVNAKELKAWLRGIQEFQPEGWVPSIEQWDAIRERIFLLEEFEGYSEPPADRQGYAPDPVYAPVVYTPTASRQPVDVVEHRAGPLATSVSPTETGVIPASSASTVLEGEYQSSFK